MAEVQAGKRRRPAYLALSSLPDNTLWIVLFCRGEPMHNNYHWAFYLHGNADSGGVKLHATSIGSAAGWIADTYSTTAITKEFLLVGLVRIADVDPDNRDKVMNVIRQEDGMLNELEGFTCRIYIKRACERLKLEKLLQFPDWDTLQSEVFTFGNKHVLSAEENVQPRPSEIATVCYQLK